MFPDRNLIEIEDELRYVLRNDLIARAYNIVACGVIVAKGLPLVAMIDVWMSRGEIREISLVVRMAPEQDVIERTCGDECQDGEGLSGGWWGRNEE